LSLFDKIDVRKNFGAFLLSLRLLRILRVFRKVNIFGKMRSLIDTILYIVKKLLTIGLLLLVFIFIYSCIGTAVFGKVSKRTYITKTNNFDNFYKSAILLFQVVTTEDWVDIMNELAYHDCTDKTSEQYANNNYCKEICYNGDISYEDFKNNKFSCGTNFSYFYFITYMIIGSIFIMNLFVVIVIDGFNNSMFENEGQLSEDLILELINLWKEYSPNADYFINQQDFILILKELTPPMGMNYDRYIIEGINDNIKVRNKEFIQFESCKKIIEFNNELLDINKAILALPEHYQYNNFYLSKNKKIYTNDKEIMKIIDKYNIKVYSPEEINENNENIKNKHFYTFSALNYDKIKNKENFSYYNDNYIHFIDACIILSQIATSKVTCVFFDKLRRSFVNQCSKKFWEKSYSKENIEKFFSHDEQEQKKTYKKLLSVKILNKFKNNLIGKLTKVREKINKRNSLKNDFQQEIDIDDDDINQNNINEIKNNINIDEINKKNSIHSTPNNNNNNNNKI
jgi:hypothetical protein